MRNFENYSKRGYNNTINPPPCPLKHDIRASNNNQYIRKVKKMKETLMNSKIVLIIVIVVLALGTIAGMYAVIESPESVSHILDPISPVISSANFTNVDIHQINAQIFANTTDTNGIAGYLTAENPNGVMPTALIITARSPGNSTLTLSVNGTYIFHNMVFSDITTQSFNIAHTGNMSFSITIHSGTLGLTRILHYTGNLKTPTQFINYVTSKRALVSPLAGLSVSQAFIIFGLPTGMAVFGGILSAEYWRHEKNRNPNFDDYVIGGVGN